MSLSVFLLSEAAPPIFGGKWDLLVCGNESPNVVARVVC